MHLPEVLQASSASESGAFSQKTNNPQYQPSWFLEGSAPGTDPPREELDVFFSGIRPVSRGGTAQPPEIDDCTESCVMARAVTFSGRRPRTSEPVSGSKTFARNR